MSQKNEREPMNFYLVVAILFVSLMNFSLSFAANETAGPHIRFETVGTQTRRFMANLAAPLPNFLGNHYFTTSFHTETRRAQNSSSFLPSDSKNMTLGVAVFPDFAVLGVAPVATYARFSDPHFSFRPMNEFIVGVYSTSIPMSFSPDDYVSSSLVLRLRHYVWGQRWQPFLFHKIETPAGWVFDVGIPSHGTVGYRASKDVMFSAGARAQSRDFVGNVNGVPGWFDGYTLSIFAGFRQRLHGIFHFNFEFGAQSESIKFHSELPTAALSVQNSYQPFGAIALQTYFVSH